MSPTLILAAILAAGGPAWAGEKSSVGPRACADCHTPEHSVWEQTPHALSFKTVHKAQKAKDILAAAGGEANIRKNALCAQCHFTLVPGEDGTPAAKAGPSCESCHGPASEWLKIHDAFAGPGGKKEGETAAQREKRIAEAEKAGMIRPERLYDLSAQCLACHGLSKPSADPAVLGKMLEAGHPFDPGFEMVRFSQGTLRHRFLGADKSVNLERTPAELSRLFVAGQAAKLVSAKSALDRGGPQAWQDIQNKRLSEAQKALQALKSLPEAAALAADPSEENARKLVAAAEGKDLSEELKGLLPLKADYK